VAIASVIAAGTLTLASNAYASSAVPSSLDQLFTQFGVDKVPADFVVVVDTSGSMSEGANPPYPAVLNAFGSLVDAIPEGDNLSVLTFDSSPNLVFQGRVDGQSREVAKGVLPPVAQGQATDIGASLDAALRRLERADASDVQTVIFLTDGLHQPAAGSAYPTTNGPEWDALRARAQQVDVGHDTAVQGIGLGEQGAGGIALLRQVFGNPEINSLPAEQLPNYFRESVRRSQVARLAKRVDEDIARGVKVEARGSATLSSDMTVDVALHSQLQKLPVDVTVKGVEVTDSEGKPVKAELVDDAVVRLEPGGTAKVAVRVEPSIGDAGFRVPPVTERDEFDVEVDASYQVQPKDLLTRVTATPTSGAVTGVEAIAASRTFGRSITQIVAFLAAIALLAFILLWLYRRFLQLPKLVGVFVLDQAVDDHCAVIPLKGKHQRLTGKDVPRAGAAKIELFTRRGKPKRVYARVETPPFAEVEDRGREKLIAEEAEIRVNRYRLGGGRMKYWPKAPEQARKR
jgi:Mg-chelatase subunit ChlD